MKRILQIMTLLLFAAPALAQTGHLKGKVLDNSQDPLIGVTVMVVGTEKGAITDIDGSFNISGLPTGTAVVRLSFVGFKTVEITTTIEPNKTTLLEDITLYEGNEILQDVVVTGSRVNAFSREQTAYVAKLPLKDLENTQVTGDLSPLQGMTSMQELSLSNTQVKGDLAPLQGMTSMQELSLGSTQVAGDLMPLRFLMSVRNLDISNSQVLAS